MQPFYEKVIRTDFTVSLNVNGSQFQYSGVGSGNAQLGDVDVRVNSHDSLPAGFHPAAMSFTLITGQADISTCRDGSENPFQQALGAYKAKRTLDLGKFGRLVADYVVSPPDGNTRTAKFDIKVNVDLPKLVSIEPSVETWRPRSGGKVYDGRFEMVWNTEDGRQIKGVTHTVYEFEKAIPNPVPLSRSIIFTLKTNDNELIQSEVIRLYKDETGARSELGELVGAMS